MKKTSFIFTLLITMFIAAPVWAENNRADNNRAENSQVDNNPSAQNDPKAVVENTITAMLQVLENRADKSKVSKQDRAAIRKIIEGKFDYASMAKRSLGRPWKALDNDDRTHFTAVFRDLLELSYGNRLSAYKGQKVEFANAEIKKKRARVKSTIIDGDRKTPVNYRLHQTVAGWQVYDIRIEGTSLVRTFNQDFKSTLDAGGYKKLVAALEKKVAKLKNPDKN